MNFVLGMIAGAAAVLIVVTVIANSLGSSKLKDCESMGQSRFGDKTIICSIKKEPQ